MIDIVPGASKAPPVSTLSGQSGTNAADSSARGLNATASAAALSDTQQPGSFASTLQSRLKLMALNKNPSLAHLAIPAAPPLPGRDMEAVNQAAQAATIYSDDLLASKDSAANAAKADDTTDDADQANTAAITSSPTPASPALNIVNVAPAPVVQHAPAPLPATSTSQSAPDKLFQKESGSGSSGNPVEPATTAILAVEPEKIGLTAANPDNRQNESGTFQDALNNRLALASANTGASNALTHQRPANTIPIVAREVQTPLASAHWATDVGNQLSWMSGNNQSRADLVLNPPQLGRIEVSITMNGDQATASFVSANPEVRDVLQGSLPRLREVLADAGVFLGQTNIGAESFSQNQSGGEKGGKSPDDSFVSSGQSLLGSLSSPLAAIGPAQTIQGRGLIDLFA